MSNIGFIGCGRLGSAMLKRLASKGGSFKLFAHDNARSKIDHINRYVDQMNEKLKEGVAESSQHVTFVESIEDLVKTSDYIFIAVQQNKIVSLLDKLALCLTEGKVLISLMGSVPRQYIRAKTHYLVPVVRILANIPVAYGKGVLGISYPEQAPEIEIKNRMTYSLSEEQEEAIGKFLKHLGQRVYLSEEKVSIFAAVVTCGPTYTFLFMEALLQAALTAGIPYLEAKKCVANCVEGSAYMGAHDTQSFNELRMHASPPGGIAIRAINEMELKAVRGEITSAILSANDYNIACEAKLDDKL